MRASGLAALGLVVGFASAALGVGGGIIMVPALVLLFHLDIKKAVGTSLAAIIPISAVGIAAHYAVNAGNMRVIVAAYLAAGAVIGTRGGAAAVKHISGAVLSRLFAALLLFSGLELAGVVEVPVRAVTDGGGGPVLLLIGLAIGFASALFGVGGGIIMVPLLNIIFGLTIHEATATSLLVVLPTSIAGALFHRSQGTIAREALLPLLPTALIGAALGAVAANALSGEALELAFGVLLLVSAARLFLEREKEEKRPAQASTMEPSPKKPLLRRLP